jgi:FkbM family methyltransferase
LEPGNTTSITTTTPHHHLETDAHNYDHSHKHNHNHNHSHNYDHDHDHDHNHYKMRIFYGIDGNNIEVTEICLTKLMEDDFITIPEGDTNRAVHFTDPLPGILKKIFILIGSKVQEYEDIYRVRINTLTNQIYICTNDVIMNKLLGLWNRLQIKNGSFNEEFPEQKMAVRYLTGSEKVLEIGGNIGRNSLIIASILEGSGNVNNMVSMECDADIAELLIENRDLNQLHFHVESSALSKRKLIQQDWNTKPSDELEEGYQWVNTISLEELRAKYAIEFDTLVLDCEGAFYYILMDMPEILDNIRLIIMENDYHEISQKQYVDEILTQSGFYIDYTEKGGWGCCFDNFYEVWRRNLV